MVTALRPRRDVLPLSLFVAATLLLVQTPRYLFVRGAPYMLLINSRPKCVTVEAPDETTLIIEYDAPDMIVPTEQVEEAEDNKGKPNDYQRAMQQAERRKAAMADMMILMNQKMTNLNRDRWRDAQRRRGGLPGPRREELRAKRGTVLYDTYMDGTVEICAQSLSANPSRPARVSLRVTVKPTEKPVDNTEEEGQKLAERELSRMEGNIRGLIRKVELILSQADFSKEQEVIFHEQSLAMNRASQWWPIVQLSVLIVTAFTQVNHMVRFFKSRHIL